MWPWVFIELYLKNICAISLQMHVKKNPYEVFFAGIVFLLLYCSLQYAHTGTWLTLIKKKKTIVSMKSIHDLEDSFYDKSL